MNNKSVKTILLSIAFYLCGISCWLLCDILPRILILSNILELLTIISPIVGIVLMIMSIVAE